MARGGYRPGAGRPKKGTKKTVSKSDELTPEQKENVRIMLAFGERLKDGGKLTRTERKQLEGFRWD